MWWYESFLQFTKMFLLFGMTSFFSIIDAKSNATLQNIVLLKKKHLERRS